MSEHREPLPTGRRTYRVAGLREASSTPVTPFVGHVEDLVAPYALGALEPDEAAVVDAHVRGCPSCEQKLLDAQRTAGMLSFAVPLHTPSLDTKAALFVRVAHAQRAAATASLPTYGVNAFRTPTLPASAGVEELVAPSRRDSDAPAQSAQQSRSGWLVSAVSLPLLVALIATGFWGIQLRNQLSAQGSQLAELQSELTNFGAGTTTYPLSPGVGAPQAEGKIVLGADERAGMVQIDVNSTDGPSQYEMWVNKDGNLIPVSEFTVDPNGKGQARFELDQPFSEYESVHIQAKPVAAAEGGSPVDSLVREQDSPLGSTGSGLDVGP